MHFTRFRAYMRNRPPISFQTFAIIFTVAFAVMAFIVYQVEEGNIQNAHNQQVGHNQRLQDQQQLQSAIQNLRDQVALHDAQFACALVAAVPRGLVPQIDTLLQTWTIEYDCANVVISPAPKVTLPTLPTSTPTGPKSSSKPSAKSSTSARSSATPGAEATRTAPVASTSARSTATPAAPTTTPLFDVGGALCRLTGICLQN